MIWPSKYSHLTVYIHLTKYISINLQVINTDTERISRSKGIWQEDISHKLFNIILKGVIKVVWANSGVKIIAECHNHLIFTDNIVLITDNEGDVKKIIVELENVPRKLLTNLGKTRDNKSGLYINNSSTKDLVNVREYVNYIKIDVRRE